MSNIQEFPDSLADVPAWLKSQREKGIVLSYEDSNKLSAKINDFVRRNESTEKRLRERAEENNAINIKLSKDIEKLQNILETKNEDMVLAKDKFYDAAKEIVESDISTSISSAILEQIQQHLQQDQYNELKKRIVHHTGTQSEIGQVGLISMFGQSSMPAKPSDLNFERVNNGVFDLFCGWNRNDVSADSIRAMIYPSGISVALCDGTSEGAQASLFTSRIYSTLFTQGFPLTDVFCEVFCRGHTALTQHFFDTFLRYRYEDESFPTHLLRNLPYELKKSVWDDFQRNGKGATTAVNAIILNNGLLWTSSVGDSALYHFRSSDNTFCQILPTQTTIGAGTSAIGINNFHEPTTPFIAVLEPGDVVFLTSDLLSDTEYSKWHQKVIDIHHLPQTNLKKSRKLWTEVVRSTEESDDISIVSVMYTGEEFDPDMRIVEKESHQLVVDGQTYELENEKYYAPSPNVKKNLFTQVRSGLKIIPQQVCASLDVFRTQFEGKWPDFIPKFEIFRDGDRYFIEITHFEGAYVRLDYALKAAGSRDEIIQIRNLLTQLEKKMERHMISYGDISPTNIFLNTSDNSLHLIDLNSLMWPGSIPPPRNEKGHSGMYGVEKGYSNLPSLFAHRLPFRVLDLTLYLLSMDDFSITKYRIEETVNEEYVLTAEEVSACYTDLSKHPEIIEKITKLFPGACEKEIKKLLTAMYFVEIFK